MEGAVDSEEAVKPDGAASKPDWQIGHTERNDTQFVIYDLAEASDDPGACTIVVKGKGAEAMAKRLVALLGSDQGTSGG